MDISPGNNFNPLSNRENHPAAAAAARAKIEALNTVLDTQTIGRPGKTSVPEPQSPALTAAQGSGEVRRMPSKVRPIVSAILSFLFLLAFFKSEILLSQLKYLTAKPATQTAQTSTVVGPNPVLLIPKLNINAPVIYPTTTADGPNYDKELESGVVHYPNTALPGQNGNAVIFGHSSNDWWEPGNYKFVFVLLDKVGVGDTFQVNYQSQQYTYRVTNVKIVEPTDLSVLAPTANPTMTLITCTPPGTSWKRLVVQANQIKPAAGETKVASTAATPQAAGKSVLPSNAPGLLDQIGQLWNSFLHLVGLRHNQASA